MISYSVYDLLLYLMLYSFLGWVIDVAVMAVVKHSFVNRGFLNLPIVPSYGIAAVLLILILPDVRQNYLIQYVLTFVTFCIVWNLSCQFVRSVSKKSTIPIQKPRDISSRRDLPFALSVSAVLLVVYLIVHPLVFTLVTIMPELLVRILSISFAVLVIADYLSVRHALRTNRVSDRHESRRQSTHALADRINRGIWNRLQKAYPGIQDADEEEHSRYVFAQGLCFDKLVWVFLVSSFLGALIEMVFCRVTGGEWMNRSSLLYGSFSVVWGFGAVLLTVVLQRLAGKEDRKVFLAGFFVGGVYEYFCSVLSELVFGTVFWDYSEMPLNIGGRTNVLYCIFWGLLAVVWIKMIYPPMSRGIEKMPALAGKILTWIVVIVMVCDGLLTGFAMIRYTQRQTADQPGNIIETFIDSRYDDDYMEKRWPNMVVVE